MLLGPAVPLQLEKLATTIPRAEQYRPGLLPYLQELSTEVYPLPFRSSSYPYILFVFIYTLMLPFHLCLGLPNGICSSGF
jgi:hypothetical protein